jgi:hypothetical protein
MAQKTNLNVSPYFDDFNSDKGYYKVLFSPGKPVQARELNTLQSQLQNQIETFGSHIFKDGSMVIPGGVTYDSQFYAVKLNPRQFGVDINIYINSFIGKKIVGRTSQVSAIVDYIAFPEDSDEVDNITLYVKYVESDVNNEFSQFRDGEELYALEDVVYGNTTIRAQTTFASVISENGTAIGSAAHINNGIYFIRGFFVEVLKQTIILDYYTNTPTYKIGLNVNEEIITAKDDNSLYDNAKGFTNFAAPGADRFKISLTLDKRLADDSGDPNFIELMRTDAGELKKEDTTTQYSLIRDYLAKRTYDESGDYSVQPFTITVNESLNNRIGNDGLFFENEKTDDGNDPSSDLAAIKISPGVAYVGGYDVLKTTTTIIDTQKPRTTEKESNVSVLFKMGNYIRVNNVTGCPSLKNTVDLYDGRKNSTTTANGEKIGEARVYNFSLTDSPYEGTKTSWDLYLFDVQTYTQLTLNSALSSSELPATSFVKGKSSGATGFAVSAGNGTSTILTLRETSGTFTEGEQILINGVDDSPRTIRNVRNFGIQDIKSVFQSGSPAFIADSLLSQSLLPGFSSQDVFRINSTGQVSCPGKFFSGITTNTIISYVRGDSDSTIETVPYYNRVSSISPDGTSMQLEAVSTVSGVCNGSIGAGTTSSIRIFSRIPSIVSYNDGSLYAELPLTNVSSVDLQNSLLTFKSQADSTLGTVTGNELVVDSSSFDLPIGLSTASFQGFDQERYSIHYTDGTTETLSSDKFDLDIAQNQVTFSGISNKDIHKVNATLIKSGIRSKVKVYNKSKVVDVIYSKYQKSGDQENSSVSDGLTYKEYYGLRVQDEEICLNYPDVAKIIAVFESLDSNSPQLDQLTFSSLVNVANNSIIGEQIVGQTSGAVCQLVRKPIGSPNNIEFVYLNSNRFVKGETVSFKESEITTEIDDIILGKYKNITNSYALNGGQKTQYYDYSRLVRKPGEPEPSKKITVIFDHYTVPQDDNGDAFTVLSYSRDQYLSLIPRVGPDNISASELLDFRPRVESIDDVTLISYSPFDFSSRDFVTNPTNLNVILAPDEVSILGVEYYVARIDKIFLDRQGRFVIKNGNPGAIPSPPEKIDAAMELATIYYPPFLENAKDAFIALESNRRYTMRDIGKIETRVKTLEKVTSLSLLESSTQNLQIRDADGLNRFKTGFFVDDFKDTSYVDTFLSAAEVDSLEQHLAPIRFENTLPNIPETVWTNDLDNLSKKRIIRSKDGNIRFTGDPNSPSTLSLDYTNVAWIEQPIATQVENVNPFHVVEYRGQVTLSPNNDRWVRTYRKLPDKIIQKSNTIYNTIDKTRTNTVNVDGGLTRVPARQFDATLLSLRSSGANFTFTMGTGPVVVNPELGIRNGSRITQTTTTTTSSTNTTTNTTSSSTSSTVTRLINVEDEKYMRSRNTEFFAVNLMPFSRFYQFLDSQSGVKFVPKILEISKFLSETELPLSVRSPGAVLLPGFTDDVSKIKPTGSNGVFRIGEDVIGYDSVGKQVIRFKVAQPNHKNGPFNAPESTYGGCPYDRNITLPSNYTSSLGYLNIDTKSLSAETIGDYYGFVTTATKLVGQTSKAVAYVTRVRLVSDAYGDLQGCFFLDDPNIDPRPPVRISTGTKTYKLTNSPTNATPLPGSKEISSAETSYEATGLLRTVQNETTITTTNLVTTTNITTITRTNRTTTLERYDPLAQSFEVGRTAQSPQNSNINPIADRNGVYLTAVDIYFRKVDSGNSPVTIEVRTMELGTPTLTRIGEAVTLRPDDTLPNGRKLKENISEDASLATTVVFPYPIFLAPDDEYAIVLLAPESVGYEVFIAEMNKPSLNTQFLTGLPEAERVKYSKQFAIGSLFKSQNGSIWTADQNQDLKFKLYKARFNPTGTVFFYNPPLNTTTSNSFFGKLPSNPIVVYPRKLKIGITTTATGDSIFTNLNVGRKVSESVKTYNYGFVEGLGGPAGTVGITTGGVNYSNTTGAQTFNISGNGSGLLLDITTTNGTVTSVTANTSGSGYKVGDVVGILTSSVSGNTGNGAVITISAVTDYDTIYLTNVQGQTFTNAATLQYFNNAGARTSSSLSILNSTTLSEIYQGNIMKVSHFGHNMYSSANRVAITGVESDLPPQPLVSEFNANSQQVSIASTIGFDSFEGIPVSAANPGYIKIGSEIVSYTGVANGGVLTGLTRSIDSTIGISYNPGELVMKYELSGISLRRINRENTLSTIKGDIDTYYIQISRTSGSTLGPNRNGDSVQIANTPQLSFNKEDFVGGEEILSTQNLLFDTITPSFDVYGPGSNIAVSASVRTISGTSAGGNETPFLDLGYQQIQLNAENKFVTPRMVCSRPNETQYLAELPNSKSFTTALTLSTTDLNLSPQVFLDGCVTNFSISRLDNPVSNYIFDRRANEIEDNSHAARYVSNPVLLAQPATSLKVIITAYRNSSSDFRVLYNLISADSYQVDQAFTLFPGYENLTIDNNQDGYLDIVNPSLNSGLPDTRVAPSADNEYREYEYTAPNLKEFVGFTLKIVMSGTDQSKPPIIRDIRAIALA